MSTLLRLTSVLALSSAAAAQQLLVVDPSGGADYADLQAAVLGASSGAQILVRDGVYGSIDVAAKSLSIVADGFCVIEGLTVRDLSAAQTVTIRGLRFVQGTVPAYEIDVHACAGSVWLEELQVEGDYQVLQSPLSIQDSRSVVISRCLLNADGPLDRPVASLVNSSVYVFDSELSAFQQTDVIRQQDGFLGLYEVGLTGCSFFFCGGSVPLHLTGTDPHAELQGVVLRSSLPPRIEAGSLATLASTPRTHAVGSPVHDDETVEVTLTGQPDDAVFVYYSTRPRTGLAFPTVDVPLLLGGSLSKVILGRLPHSASPTVTSVLHLPIGDLPPGTATELELQALFRPPSGRMVFSEPTVVTLLDSGLRAPVRLFEPSASWQASPPNNVLFGATLAAAGDVNADGYGDVLVGDPGFQLSPVGGGYQSYGAAHVYLGTPTGLQTNPNWTRVGTQPETGSGTTAFGVALGAAGDLDGDGFDDVFAAARGEGSLHVFYGSAAGIGARETVIAAVPGQWNFEGQVVAPGDVNGDGFDDVLLLADCVGTCHASGGNRDHYAFLYRGSAAGVQSAPSWSLLLSVSVTGAARAGDVNGDGFDDLLLAWVTGDSHHRLSLYLGTAGDPQLAWTYEDPGLLFNGFSGVGDVDGDGFDDLVLGADLNRLLLFRGGATPVGVPSADVRSVFFGEDSPVLPVGDVDRDGHADLIVRTFMDGRYSWNLIGGTSTGLATTPIWRFLAPPTAAGVTPNGFNLAPAGDVNGDGRVDLLLGEFDGSYYPTVQPGNVKLFKGRP